MSTLPKLFSSPSSKIFSTNKENIVEVNNDRIIESDSEFREVVKQGYLLNMINLSTIPDIIADAIADAIIDAKDLTLADSLLSTLRTDLENLDDGVYKKTYIDNTITYLEDLLTSKVDAETVASIADSKIATASEGFAATSTVELLTSRVGNSESEIITMKDTINTKDLARAAQIETLEASIDESFSGYSEAIDLVVESDGSVRAKKIEDLRVEFESEIGLVNASITDTNELIVEKDVEWKANSMKLITNPTGGITGYSFQDGSGLKSNFTINADTFKISNSTNTYTPFSIVDNNLLFNGRVTFSNITGGDSILTVDNVQDAINNNVTSIDGGKIVTNAAFVNNLNAVGGIVADSVKAYNLTSTNATIEDGLITNAKIGTAAITTAKIGDLSVSTLKIQDEAVIVPRSASTTSGVATIVYTPATSHTITIFGYAKLTPNLNLANEFYIKVNGITIVSNTYGNTSMIGIYNLVAGTSYTITSWYKTTNGGLSLYSPVNIIMLGVKK